MMKTRNHVIVTGHGRSGSNYVLDLLDCHEGTFCRNEPNKIAGSELSNLPNPLSAKDLPADFMKQLSDALAEAAFVNGVRDRFCTHYKDYSRSHLLSAAGDAVFARRRARRALSILWPAYGRDIWPVPEVYLSRSRLSRTLPVFKMLLVSSWLKATHTHASGQRVIHIIRDPEGFLNSWYNRYVLRVEGGPEGVFQDNLATLDVILEYFGQQKGKFGIFTHRALLETELWRWRYFNETLFDALYGSNRYLPISYREVRADPLRITQHIYKNCGLFFDDRHAERVAHLRNELFAAPHRTRLDPADVAAAKAAVMEDSRMSEFLASSETSTPGT